eukprot:s2456_g2.t4
MNVDVPIHDAEVVCNGLPLWQGAQLAVDATLVSPVSRDGTETQPGAAVRTAARRKRRQTYPELDRGRRYRLVWSWDAEAASFLRLLARARASAAPAALRPAAQAAWERPRCSCCAAGACNHGFAVLAGTRTQTACLQLFRGPGPTPVSCSHGLMPREKRTIRRPAAQLKQRPAATTKCSSICYELPRAVVVNLHRRADRWREVRQRLDGIEGLKFDRMQAVDGQKEEIHTREVTKTWSTAKNWHYVTRAFEGGAECGYTVKELCLSEGERGCAASHVKAWRACAASRKPLMVFEDDAKPHPKFKTVLCQAMRDLHGQEPDILYLGYSKAAPWRRKVSAVVWEAEYLWTTVAYVLWPTGASALLGSLPVNQPVDNFIAEHVAGNKLRAFATVPKIVGQARPWNVENDVLHSDDVAWVQNQRLAAGKSRRKFAEYVKERLPLQPFLHSVVEPPDACALLGGCVAARFHFGRGAPHYSVEYSGRSGTLKCSAATSLAAGEVIGKFFVDVLLAEADANAIAELQLAKTLQRPCIEDRGHGSFDVPLAAVEAADVVPKVQE